jgi:hypothetical protein
MIEFETVMFLCSEPKVKAIALPFLGMKAPKSRRRTSGTWIPLIQLETWKGIPEILNKLEGLRVDISFLFKNPKDDFYFL